MKRIIGLFCLFSLIASLLPSTSTAQVFQESAKSFRVTLFVNGRPAQASSPALFYMIRFSSEAMTSEVRIERGFSGNSPTGTYPNSNLQFEVITWVRNGAQQTFGRLNIDEVRQVGPGQYQIMASG